MNWVAASSVMGIGPGQRGLLKTMAFPSSDDNTSLGTGRLDHFVATSSISKRSENCPQGAIQGAIRGVAISAFVVGAGDSTANPVPKILAHVRTLRSVCKLEW